MGVTKERIYADNEKNMRASEEAGAAFALSALNSEKYNDCEIGAIQTLNESISIGKTLCVKKTQQMLVQ